MSDQSATIGKCPPKQHISEWVDGDERAEVTAHLEHCGDCQRVAEAYKKVNQATRTAVTPSADLNERIKAACARESLAVAPARVLWYRLPIVRLAAAVAVTASLVSLLGLTVSRLGSGNGSGNQIADAGTTSNSGANAAVTAAMGSPGAEPVADNAGQPGNRVNPNDVVKVNIPGVPGQAVPVDDEGQVLVQLPQNIRHVWAVTDLQASEKYLKSLLKGTRYTTTYTAPKRMGFDIQLRDSRLQNLVNTLARRKWALLSSCLPQPQQGTSPSYLGRRVTYDLELVSVKKDQ